MTTHPSVGIEPGIQQNTAREIPSREFPASRPHSFDWALLCLRVWFGSSIFIKHGIDKIRFFHSMSATFPDPIHVGPTATLIVVLFVDVFCSLLTVVGLATRWAALASFAITFLAWTMNGHPYYFGHNIVADHGELTWLYLGVNAALVIMGAGQFSLDWKLSRSKVAHLLWLDVFSSSSAGKVVRPTVGNSTWAVVILLVVTGGAWAVWMQRTVGSPPGQSAPNFSLPSQDGRAISLSQLTGKSVVLFFYSKNSDAQDALEAQTFQRDLEKYTALNTVVIGVSPDSVEDNKEFAIKNSITFPLLTADRVTIDSYKVPISGNGQNLAVEHDTFLISPKGTIITYWPAKEGQIYSDQVLAAIRKQR